MGDSNAEENTYNVLNTLATPGEENSPLDAITVPDKERFNTDVTVGSLDIPSNSLISNISSDQINIISDIKDLQIISSGIALSSISTRYATQKNDPLQKVGLKIAPPNLNQLPNVLFKRINAFHNLVSANVNSTDHTAVEQPSVGPCACFICGCFFNESSEKFSIPKIQKMFSMQLTLLQLLSDILNQRVLTNADSIDLCRACFELLNEIDDAFKQLEGLRERIIKLFSGNQRPKLTYQILPKNSNLKEFSDNTLQPKIEPNLKELSLTSPRRVRKAKNSVKPPTKDLGVPIKKKFGRPRKPYQCTICKRKFLMQSILDGHIFREHPESFNTLCKSHNVIQSKDIIKETPTLEPAICKNEHTKKKYPISVETKDETKFQHEPNKVKQNVPIIPKATSNDPSLTNNSLIEAQVNSLSFVRPIQPKPQTVMHTASDGSLVFLMNSGSGEPNSALIKVSPGYLTTKTNGYFCYFCDKSFITEKSYRMHKMATHKSKKKTPEDESNYKNLTNKIFTCRLCKVCFFSKRVLMQHRKLVHKLSTKINKDQKKEKLYSCEHCSHTFNFKYEMESHRESHLPFNQIGPHEFVCSICGLKVASKTALKIHFHRFHNKEEEAKDFLCSKCGYMAATKKAFSDHLRIHDENPAPKIQCTICKKEMLPSSYRIHLRRIHGEAKHSCYTCGQRFTVRSDLMKHLNTVHSSLKPYDCSICNLKFVTSEALRYHRNKVHSTVFHFCDLCGKCCRWKGELRTHISRCHSDSKVKHQCSYCQITYNDKRKLKRHVIAKHNIPKETSSCKTFKPSWSGSQDSAKSQEDEKKSTNEPNYESQQAGVSTDESRLKRPSPLQSPMDAQLSHSMDAVQTHNLNNMQVYQESQDHLSLSTMENHIEEHSLQTLQQENSEISHSHSTQSDVVTQLLATEHLHSSQTIDSPIGLSSHEHHSDHLESNSNPLEAVPALYLVSDVNMISMQDESS